MVVCFGMVCGSHSAVEIFREARRRPCFRHAVKAAPRAWWKESTIKAGRIYPGLLVTRSGVVHRIHFSAEFRAWDLVVNPLNMWGACYDYAAQFREFGVRVVDVPLAMPHAVLMLAARELGLTCSSCGQVDLDDYWALPDGEWFCPRCDAARRSYPSDTHFAVARLKFQLGKLRGEVRRQHRAERMTT